MKKRLYQLLSLAGDTAINDRSPARPRFGRPAGRPLALRVQKGAGSVLGLTVTGSDLYVKGQKKS